MFSNVQYEFLGLRFAVFFGESAEHVAQFRGRAVVGNYSSNFDLMLAALPGGRWGSRHLGWERTGFIPPALQQREFLQKIIDHGAHLLNTTNMWPESQTEAGAKISLNQQVIPPEHDERVIVSYRHNMLGFPSTRWDLLWDQIERRVHHDPYFVVLGFEREEVARILPRIKRVFPNDWVGARFRRIGQRAMNSPIEPEDDGFFPAYHLARTAHGVICRDPGWNYLVEIGLAVEALKDVKGIDRLVRRLSASPGTQHHLCLAAELHKRGHLKGLEPSTGSGVATSDILAEISDHSYQIEVKEFSSKMPLVRLRAELEDKVRKLPTVPAMPVVFHVVFRETGAQDVRIEQEFFRNVSGIADEIPAKISAVVVGRRFVDSLGGLVKRDYEQIILNAKAVVPSNEEHLGTLFAANYGRSHLPYYSLSSLFVFGERRKGEDPELPLST